MSLLDLAKQLAFHAHKDQFYGSEPYTYHLNNVANLLASHGYPEKYQIVAWLHDIVEDTIISFQTIEDIFGDEICSAVLILTKDKTQTYDEYINEILKNDIARVVKLHDAFSNLSCSLLNRNKQNVIKYANVIHSLRGI